ncbi:hypothetical protein DPMN_047699 [Dreissena polymorpha]|uniref:Uncharacterized protein n=1 Tax=Dreissena polymorpha TaxID=45954 RepID=A0A9D4I3B5_DREPO|nr:hypothetical protein DPMN_047699 [Dreissena polymorpha]
MTEWSKRLTFTPRRREERREERGEERRERREDRGEERRERRGRGERRGERREERRERREERRERGERRGERSEERKERREERREEEERRGEEIGERRRRDEIGEDMREEIEREEILGSDADELSAAAAWLHKATGDQAYLNLANSFYPAGTAWGFAWNDANVGAAVANAAFVAVVAASDGIKPDEYKKYAMSQINYILDDN